jgi:hypothetical protein
LVGFVFYVTLCGPYDASQHSARLAGDGEFDMALACHALHCQHPLALDLRVRQTMALDKPSTF